MSQRYLGTRRKLLWECKLGHKWKSTPDSFHAGQWCPECGTHIAEAICRVYFEHIFKRRFPKVRPKWLVNADGNQMELDGYCRSLSLAFEHHGVQHYQQSRFFHSKSGFEKRVTDDDKKRTLCRRHGVTLIEVPQIGKLTRLAVLGAFIVRECRKRRKNLVFKNCDFDG